MKNWIVALALSIGVTATAFHAHAQPILEGAQELGISGFIDFDTPNKTEFRLSGQYGIFVMDYLQVGPRVSVFDNDVYTAWKIGGFAEYNFDTGTPWVPFVGAGLNIAGIDVATGAGGEDNTGLSLTLSGGGKYFLTEQVALSSALNFELATAKLYPARRRVKDTDWNVEVGLRFFF